jgi:hypothetical protein
MPTERIDGRAGTTVAKKHHRRIAGWRWKITGIDLPEKLRDQIAGELAKKNP